MNKIPFLTPKDVELRAGMTNKSNYGTFVTLLAYKNARCTQRILDEVYGPLNWQVKYENRGDKLWCILSIYNEEIKEWITKEDIGTPSKTAEVKGEVSDAFKRAATTLGIGRELYDVPIIRIKLNPDEINDNGQIKAWVKFHIKEMKYNEANSEFDVFTVVDDKGNIRFSLNNSAPSNSAKDSTSTQTPASTHETAPTAETKTNTCSKCGASVTEAEAGYSTKVYGQALCRKCQAQTKKA